MTLSDDFVQRSLKSTIKKIKWLAVSSGVGRTECWHEHKSFTKHSINLISKPFDKLDHRCSGKIFDLNFLCIVVVQSHEMQCSERMTKIGMWSEVVMLLRVQCKLFPKYFSL